MNVFTKPIFNSLGSNYSFVFGWQAIQQLLNPSQTAIPKLEQRLLDLFQAREVVLTYKGRDAIEYALRLARIGQGDQVITQAFTCHAIEEAITRAEALPVFADISLKTINPTIKTLDQALDQATQAKAVIIQHTLGIPAEIKQIKAWCQTHKLLLIEDLASSIGGVDEAGVPLGTYGDVVILSFGRDKIVDGVSGGAVVIKDKRLSAKIADQPALPLVPAIQRTRDLLYPQTTWKIRAFHTIKIGRLIFWLAKLMGLLASPIKSPLPYMAALPGSHAQLALIQLAQLERSVFHRRKIADHYSQQLQGEFKLVASPKRLIQSSAVRFSLLVDQPDDLASRLKQQQIYLTDRWYRQAVDCGNLKYVSHYQPGSCPNAEKLTQQIINLPTHQNMTIRDATRVIEALKQQ